ncbi:MAG TPA: MBG domain-containing protein, partial [Prolixibacteraceae bacterium]|nr:MBG domain-containing protein [Prolixibacteraceae bacterium]
TDAPTGTLSRATGENVGSYLISKSTFTYGSNYDESFVEANLVIDQRPITITADAKSKYIGQSDPALTFVSVPSVGTILPNGQVIGFEGNLKRANGECVGTYEIGIGDVRNANYKISYVKAIFTIKGVTVDASASSTPVMINTSVLTLSAKVLDGSTLLSGVSVKFTVEDGNGVKTTYGPVNTGNVSSTLGIASIPLSNLTSKTDVLMVTATVGEGCTSSASSIAYLAIYDPTGGFVTGGGWINSPAGAYSANTALTGKANFGFNSKYEKGKTTPTGNTEFQFQTGNLNFSSSTYNVGSLVIAGSKATYKGVGTINGSGNYAFMVSAVDGDVTGGGGTDKFRIKIWDANRVIYDNNMGKDENDVPTTSLGGGSIVIHEVKTKAAEITPEPSANAFEASLKVYPNPFTEKLNIEFSYATDTRGKLEIYSVTGAKLQTLYDGPVTGGQLYNFEYLPRMVSSQVVFYHLTLDGKTQVGKVLFNERR